MRTTLLSILIFWLCGLSTAQSQDLSAGFSISEIPDSVWQKMQGRTWQPNHVISRDDLRYLRLMHWDYDGKTHHGEMVCHRLIARKLICIFTELYRQHYPIQKIRLADDYDADDERQMRDNNTSCFCFRTVSGRQKLSYHARGLAVDINPLYNPYVRTQKDGTRVIQPKTATPWCDRQKDFQYKISKGDLCYKLFLQNGFVWGGSWKTQKDYQHFEYHP